MALGEGLKIWQKIPDLIKWSLVFVAMYFGYHILTEISEAIKPLPQIQEDLKEVKDGQDELKDEIQELRIDVELNGLEIQHVKEDVTELKKKTNLNLLQESERQQVLAQLVDQELINDWNLDAGTTGYDRDQFTTWRDSMRLVHMPDFDWHKYNSTPPRSPLSGVEGSGIEGPGN